METEAQSLSKTLTADKAIIPWLAPTAEHPPHREAIDLMLAGIDPALTAVAEKDRNEASMFEAWPLKFRKEAQRYLPRGQRLLAGAANVLAAYGGLWGQGAWRSQSYVPPVTVYPSALRSAAKSFSICAAASNGIGLRYS